MGRSNRITTKKLDILFSQIVRQAGKCLVCGTSQNLQCCHIISRRYHQVRWDLRNAVAMCRNHHVYYTYHPLEWDDYIKAEIGEGTFADLKEKALQYGKIDHKALYEELKERGDVSL